MEVSPFPYHGPLAAGEVHGRGVLVNDLVERVSERRVTALIGPRRYGKTSVLREVEARLTEVATIWIDLYEVTSMIDLALRFDAALAAIPSALAEDVRPIAAAMQLNIGVAQVELSRPPKDRPDPTSRFGALVDVIVEVGRRRPIVLVLDEFSSIGRIDGAAGRLRTALQHHYRTVGLLFAGSMPSVMRQLFTDRAEPFYAQADLVEIGPLDQTAVTEIVAHGFSRTNRAAGALPGLIAALAGGHPQRTMQLADACWRATPPKGAATSEAWAQALDQVRRDTADGMERLFSNHERREKDVLRIIAGGGSIYGSAAGLLDLPRGAAQHARQALLDDGELVRTADGGHAITDPFMADWIRRTLPL